MDDAIVTVALPATVEQSVVATCVAAAPHEACGLLLGRSNTVVLAVPARNIDERPHVRYTLDPRDHFSAVRTARALALEIIGVYHSHPAGGASPSVTDTAEAVHHLLYVIVGLEPMVVVRAWRLRHGNFDAIGLVRT